MATRRRPSDVTFVRPRALRDAKLTLHAHRQLLQNSLRDLGLRPDQLDAVVACIDHVLDSDFRSSETRGTS
jgi:hypothetical protein